MGLSNERGEILTKYLLDDKERAKAIFELPLKDALKTINGDGFDFTEDELKDYAEYILGLFSKASDEINETDMQGVNGGARQVSARDICDILGVVTHLNWIKKIL